MYAKIEKVILIKKNELLDILDKLNNILINSISNTVDEYFELFKKSHKKEAEKFKL